MHKPNKIVERLLEIDSDHPTRSNLPSAVSSPTVTGDKVEA